MSAVSRSTNSVSCALFRRRSRPPPNGRADRTVSTIFFGGGTPSLMQPATIAGVLNSIARQWRVAPDAEITLEANPTSVEATRFRGYRAAGVNRVSLGVQALDDRVLAELGRTHSAREALDAVAIARSVFGRYSFDLIYARPNQEPKAWARRVTDGAGRGRRASVALSAHHRAGHAVCRASCHRQIAPARRGHRSRPVRHHPGSLRRLGLPAYEISNHARPGGECRHNLVYWRAHEYAGIGPGAHGRLDIDGERHATATEKRPETWLNRVEADGHGLITDDILTSEERGDEFLVMGLRLAEGIDAAHYAAIAGRSIDPIPHRHAARTRPDRDHAGRSVESHLARLPRTGCCSRRSCGVAPCSNLISLLTTRQESPVNLPFLAQNP